MKYTVYTELSFENEQDAIYLMNHIENIKDKTYKIKDTDMEPLNRMTTLWETRHDEDPPKPCNQVVAVDFDDPVKKVHEKKPIDPV